MDMTLYAPVKDESARLPFLNGAYIAADALEGAYLVVDGPYCVFTKAEMQYAHNLRCRLLPPLGHRRVVHTGQFRVEEVRSLSTDRTARVSEAFARVCAQPDAQVVLAASFDFHELTNFPLAAVAARHARPGGPLVVPVRSRSLGGTWRDGYAAVCAALAEAVTLRPGKTEKDAVAVVGFLRDRDEPDRRADAKELERLLGALGLRVVSLWLSGGGRKELEAAQRAGLVVSLPYAREAAKAVARRTGADLAEADLPLGLSGTESFLRTVAAAAGRKARAERFIAAESPAAVKATEEHAYRVLAGRRARLFLDDPALEARLRECCADWGLLPDGRADERPAVCFAPTTTDYSREFVHVPAGYPNYLEHPVDEAPVLGYAGWRTLTEKTAEAVLRREYEDGARP